MMKAVAFSQPGPLRGVLVEAVFAMASCEPLDAESLIDSDDGRALSETLAGNSDSFSRVVERYQQPIARQMRRFSRDPRVVEELTHDVFVEAFVSLKSYRAKGPFLHWLRKIAVRTGYRFWKRRDRETEKRKPLMPESLASAESLDAAEASDVLHSVLDRLRPRDRLVLTLLYWDGYTAEEAAKLSGWTATMVRVQAFRARKKLKKLIEESESE